MKLRHTFAVATAGVALLSLSACGSSDSGSTSTGSSQPTAAASVAGSGTGGQDDATGASSGRTPGATGRIAARQGSTLQVQNDTDGQVAVSFTAKTAVSAQVAAALKDVTVGACVSVMPASTGATSSGDSAASTVAAGTVRISQPVDGECTGGFGGGVPGGAPGGAPTDLPTDMARPDGGQGGGPGDAPSGMPSGMPSDMSGGGRGFGANGTVTAVNGNGFTVESSLPGADASTATVTVDSATTYTTTKASDASALKVGQCVVATGESDDTGAVAAERLVVSAPVDGSCSSGFAAFGRSDGSSQDGQSSQSGQGAA